MFMTCGRRHVHEMATSTFDIATHRCTELISQATIVTAVDLTVQIQLLSLESIVALPCHCLLESQCCTH